MYFEDFVVGFHFEAEPKQISKAQILAFAREWDPQPFHLDDAQAAASPYGGIIASGWQTVLIGFETVFRTKLFEKCSIGSPGVDDIRWFTPVYPGDFLTCSITVEAARRSRSKPGRGFIKTRFVIRNQTQKTVSSFLATQMLLVAAEALQTEI